MEARRERQDLIQAYKAIHGGENDVLGSVFQLNRSLKATRATSDPWNVEVPRARLDIRKYSHVVRTADRWNRLDKDTKAATTLKQFKWRLKNQIKHNP